MTYGAKVMSQMEVGLSPICIYSIETSNNELRRLELDFLEEREIDLKQN